MGSTREYVTYVAEQMRGVGDIYFRKMFGEYMIYVDFKPAVLVCDNQVYMKIIDQLKEDMGDLDTGFPYDGAKLHYILNPDQKEEFSHYIRLLYPYLNLPKRRTAE